MNLIESQLADALAFVKGLKAINDDIPDSPGWDGGMHLRLPDVIPLTPDYEGEAPVAWLVANDFNGYDLTTEKPSA